MTVLVDPPMWHRHGRVWGHLVSDTSLAELHDFAARAGIPRRGFDLDHYDVPAERYDDLVELGAQLVDGRVLVRRLRASGLRVAGRDRRPPGDPTPGGPRARDSTPGDPRPGNPTPGDPTPGSTGAPPHDPL